MTATPETSRETSRVWAVVPAAGMSRRMGFSKQTAAVHGTTMASMVVRTLLDADVAGVVVVTRTKLVDELALPSDARLRVAINDEPDSEMIDSIRIGCAACMAADPETEHPPAKTTTSDIASAEPNVVGVLAPLLGKEGPGEVLVRSKNPPESPLGKGGGKSANLSGNSAKKGTSVSANGASAVHPVAGARLPRRGVMIVPADMPSITVATCRACLQAFAADPTRIVIAAHRGKRGHPVIFPMAMCDEATSTAGGLRMFSRAHADRVVVIDTRDVGTTLDVDTPRDFATLSETSD